MGFIVWFNFEAYQTDLRSTTVLFCFPFSVDVRPVRIVHNNTEIFTRTSAQSDRPRPHRFPEHSDLTVYKKERKTSCQNEQTPRVLPAAVTSRGNKHGRLEGQGRRAPVSSLLAPNPSFFQGPEKGVRAALEAGRRSSGGDGPPPSQGALTKQFGENILNTERRNTHTHM